MTKWRSLLDARTPALLCDDAEASRLPMSGAAAFIDSLSPGDDASHHNRFGRKRSINAVLIPISGQPIM